MLLSAIVTRHFKTLRLLTGIICLLVLTKAEGDVNRIYNKIEIRSGQYDGNLSELFKNPAKVKGLIQPYLGSDLIGALDTFLTRKFAQDSKNFLEKLAGAKLDDTGAIDLADLVDLVVVGSGAHPVIFLSGLPPKEARRTLVLEAEVAGYPYTGLRANLPGFAKDHDLPGAIFQMSDIAKGNRDFPEADLFAFLLRLNLMATGALVLQHSELMNVSTSGKRLELSILNQGRNLRLTTERLGVGSDSPVRYSAIKSPYPTLPPYIHTSPAFLRNLKGILGNHSSPRIALMWESEFTLVVLERILIDTAERFNGMISLIGAPDNIADLLQTERFRSGPVVQAMNHIIRIYEAPISVRTVAIPNYKEGKRVVYRAGMEFVFDGQRVNHDIVVTPQKGVDWDEVAGIVLPQHSVFTADHKLAAKFYSNTNASPVAFLFGPQIGATPAATMDLVRRVRRSSRICL